MFYNRYQAYSYAILKYVYEIFPSKRVPMYMSTINDLRSPAMRKEKVIVCPACGICICHMNAYWLPTQLTLGEAAIVWLGYPSNPSNKPAFSGLISFFFFLIVYLFIFGCLGLCCCVGFSLVAVSRGCSLLECVGFSLWRLFLLGCTGCRVCQRSNCGSLVVAAHELSSCSSQAPGHRLSGCGVWA